MADADRDFAYVATMDLSQIEEQVGKLESRMVTFGGNVERILNDVAATANKAFSKIQTPTATAPSVQADPDRSGIGRQVELFSQLEQRMISLIANNLRLDESNSKVNRSFINTSAGVAQSVEEFRELVTVGGQVSESQFAAAQSAAQLQNSQRVVTQLLAQGSEDAELYARGLARIRAALTELESEDSLIKLISNELQLLEVNDKTAQSFTRTAAAVAPTVARFNELVAASTNISRANIELAGDIAKTKQEIAKLAAQFAKGTIDQQEYRGSLNALEGQLSSLLQQQSLTIAQNQAQAQSNQQVGASFDNLGNAISRVAQIQQQKGAVEFQKVLRTFPQISAQIRRLTDEYGPFEANIRRVSENATIQEQRFNQLINSDKRLATEVDRLTREYGEFNVALNRTTVSAGNTEGSLGKLGRNMGITTGLTIALSQELQNLARRGAQALRDLLVDSVKINQEFDAARISFAAIFQGNKQVAAGVFDFIRDESRRLGIDLAQIATSFLPQVESVEQLSKIAELSTELLRLPAAIAAGKSQTDAIIAISEFLAGQTRSLQTRFNITIQDTQRLKQALSESGIAGFLEEFDTLLSELGINFEDFANTTPFLLNRVNQQAVDLKDTLGAPIDDSLNEFLTFLEQFLRENEDDLHTFTSTLGDFFATIADFTFDEIENFLKEGSVKDLIDDIDRLQDSLNGLIAALELVNSFLKPLQELGEELDKLGRISSGDVDIKIVGPTELPNLLNILEVFGKIQEQIDRINTTPLFEDTFESPRNAVGGLLDALGAFGDELDRLRDETQDELSRQIAAGGTTSIIDAFVAQFKNIDPAITRALEELGITIEEVGDLTVESAEKSTEALLEEANAIKEIQIIAEERLQLLEQEKEVRQEVSELVDKINKQIVAFNEEANQKILEAQLDLERKRIDAIIDFSRDRKKIEQDLADDLAKIARDLADEREDILIEFARDEEDAYRDARRAQVDIDRELAKERIKIEEDFQARLAEIRRRFEFDAQEAIRNNDAIAFLQLRRKLDFELREAQIQRDEDVDDAEDAAEEQREKVNRQLQEQLEDAKIQRERAFEDAKRDFIRAERDAFIARDKAFAEHLEQIQQFNEDLALERQRVIEDLGRWYQERLRKLQESLEDEQRELKLAQATLIAIEAANNALRLREIENFFKHWVEIIQRYSPIILDLNEQLNESMSGASFPGSGTQNSDPPPPQPPPVDEDQLGELRELAKNYARHFNLLTSELEDYIDSITNRLELINLINDLQDGTLDNPIPRQMGGPVVPGQSYLVGEVGPEILEVGSGFASRIRPIGGNRLPIPISGGQITNINNSRNAQIDLSMLDPSQFSPQQIEILREVFSKLFLQAFGN